MLAKPRKQNRRAAETPTTRKAPSGHLGPVLYATLLVGARDGRAVVLDAGDCQDVVAQAARAAGLVARLRDVEALVVGAARGTPPRGVVRKLAAQVQSLVQVALTSR